jgi:hypothetical protein
MVFLFCHSKAKILKNTQGGIYTTDKFKAFPNIRLSKTQTDVEK